MSHNDHLNAHVRARRIITLEPLEVRHLVGLSAPTRSDSQGSPKLVLVVTPPWPERQSLVFTTEPEPDTHAYCAHPAILLLRGIRVRITKSNIRRTSRACTERRRISSQYWESAHTGIRTYVEVGFSSLAMEVRK